MQFCIITIPNTRFAGDLLRIDKPKSKSQVPAQSQIEKGKRNLDYGLMEVSK